MDFDIEEIDRNNPAAVNEIAAFLKQEGISLDRNLDYTCAIRNDDGQVIATGSSYGNTLRCLAVRSGCRGSGIINDVVSHLMEREYSLGISHIFIYAKAVSAQYFQDLGFYPIAEVKPTFVFMENKRHGFNNYLRSLEHETRKAVISNHIYSHRHNDGHPDAIAAVILNANPFTLGHQYLVETAANHSRLLHLFIVSEDTSLIPFNVREYLVKEGTQHIKNIVYHNTGDYLISSATFPGYFFKDQDDSIRNQAALDVEIFGKIAAELGITERYLGEESTNAVTAAYNQVMDKRLPELGINVHIIPRLEISGITVSASSVRDCISNGDWDTMRKLVPETTYSYFMHHKSRSGIIAAHCARLHTH